MAEHDARNNSPHSQEPRTKGRRIVDRSYEPRLWLRRCSASQFFARSLRHSGPLASERPTVADRFATAPQNEIEIFCRKAIGRKSRSRYKNDLVAERDANTGQAKTTQLVFRSVFNSPAIGFQNSEKTLWSQLILKPISSGSSLGETPKAHTEHCSVACRKLLRGTVKKITQVTLDSF